jgi:hypothetical protein
MRSRSRSRPSWRSALARATSEERLVALVAQAATKNWRAAAWILERRYPERWGPERLRARDVLNGVAYGKRKLPGWRLSDDRVQDVLGGTRWARVFLGPEPKRRGFTISEALNVLSNSLDVVRGSIELEAHSGQIGFGHLPTFS